MTFFSIIFRSLWRRPVRTALTLGGISVGIAAVVALVGMSSGYESSVSKQLDVIGIDVIVSNIEGGIMPKGFPETEEAKIAKIEGVKETTTVLMQMLSVEETPLIMVSGREWGGFTWDKLEVLEGRLPENGEEQAVVLGKLAAEILNKKVGDLVMLEISDFEVVGIVDGGSVVENGAIIVPLKPMQEATANDGLVNFVDVRVEPGTDDAAIDALSKKIGEAFPGKRATRASEVVGTSMGFRIVKAMSWSTSLLAIGVGILGVMNTMLMTVFERTHEIGVLLALGWRKTRIVSLILSESALLGLTGGITGVILGWVSLQLLSQRPTIKGLLEPEIGPELIMQAIAIAVVVGVVSGLYPAWRSSRLPPSVALQA